MCASGGRRARPRWWRLHAIVVAGGATLAASARIGARPGVTTALALAIVLGVFGAMALWVRASRVALDQLDWCECAAGTVRVRVVEAAPAPAPRVAVPAEELAAQR